MKDLAKWQLVSFISRGLAQVIGLLPTLFFLRVLSVTEWGLVQLALSIGAALGIYQHLGLASASTREISAAKNDKEIFKIFLTSFLVRYLVSVPLAFGLYFFSDRIATTYNNPGLILPLKLYAAVLLIQGFQSIFNSVISGTKRFKSLFTYQTLIAVVNVLIFIPFVWFYKVNGYFYALVVFNLMATFTLGILAFRPLKNFFSVPKVSEFKQLFKELLSISLGIYAVKIIYTNWERIGPNLLGLVVAPELVGYFSFALVYAKKLMNISDAATDVNLPVFSEKYVNDRKAFDKLFADNFKLLFSLIVFAGASAVYWVREIAYVFSGSDKYEPSLHLVLPIMFAFILYSFINIIKSSIIIPAKLVKEMIFSFVVLVGTTAGFYFATNQTIGHLTSMAYGMIVGALLSLFSLAVITRVRLNLKIFNHDHILLFTQGMIIAYSWDIQNLYLKSAAYLAFAALFIWGTFIAHFVSKEDLSKIYLKLTGKFHKVRARRKAA